MTVDKAIHKSLFFMHTSPDLSLTDTHVYSMILILAEREEKEIETELANYLAFPTA